MHVSLLACFTKPEHDVQMCPQRDTHPRNSHIPDIPQLVHPLPGNLATWQRGRWVHYRREKKPEREPALTQMVVFFCPVDPKSKKKKKQLDFSYFFFLFQGPPFFFPFLSLTSCIPFLLSHHIHTPTSHHLLTQSHRLQFHRAHTFHVSMLRKTRNPTANGQASSSSPYHTPHANGAGSQPVSPAMRRKRKETSCMVWRETHTHT